MLAQVADFGANPGALDMYEHVPAGLPSGRPLVVVMHGCTQTASDMEAAGWDTLADANQFAVVYPQQRSVNNPVGCFDWAGEYGDPTDLVRGMGENESVIEMVDEEIAAHGIDRDRVYVVGFSAGAAFTAVMLADWPDRFAGGSIMSGVPYRCATTVQGALDCQAISQHASLERTASQWGDLVRAADTGYAGPRPRVQVWQGGADTTVDPQDQVELVKQWTDVAGTDQTPDATETIGAVTRNEYRAGGTTVVETFRVAGMGHAVCIGTSDPVYACGAPGTYFADDGMCSTYRAATFFGLIEGSGGGDAGVDAGNGSGSGTDSGSSDGGDHGNGNGAGSGGGCNGAGARGSWALIAALLLITRRRS